MYKFLTKLVNLIYENACLICDEPSKNMEICSNCENSFQDRKNNYLKIFPEITVYSWGLYDGKLRDGILKLKGGKKKLASYLGKKLYDFWSWLPTETKDIDYLVIPIPSHKKRIKERGYCQATLIAQEFASKAQKKFSNNLVIRKKETSLMNNLKNVKERKNNIRDAFCVTGQEPREKNILIIDDILTSGSTICELARTILEKYTQINLVGLTVASGDTYN